MAEYYAQHVDGRGKFRAYGPYVTLKGAQIAAHKLINKNGYREVESPDFHGLWKKDDGSEVKIVGSE